MDPSREKQPKTESVFTTWPDFSWRRDAHDHDAQVREEAQHTKDSHHTNQPGIAKNGVLAVTFPKWPWGLEVFGSQQIMFNTHYVSKVFVRWVGGNLWQRLSFKIGTDSQQKQKFQISNTRPERIDSRYRFRYENYIVLCACVLSLFSARIPDYLCTCVGGSEPLEQGHICLDQNIQICR